MKLRLISSFIAAATVFSACQRPPSSADLEAERRRNEQMRELDGKIARLQEMERQATERKIAESDQRASAGERKASESERERQRLENERQALLKERDRLASAQRAAEEKAQNADRKAKDTARQAEKERQARTIDLFYTALDPDGDWLEVDRYGYVWRPTANSNPRWRPYTDGQWVFTDYGWTWQSKEPFGWAVYHYGRWARIRGTGWVWIPGTEWGPGWVSWRRSDRYVGWAPLPPEAWSGSGFNAAVDSYYEIGPSAYTFVPVEELGEHSYVGRVLEPERAVTIVNQTVNVTNITYTNVQNNTVVFNGGPALAEVNARATQKVPQLKVERVTDLRNPGELGRAEQRGDKLVIAAPKLLEGTATRPVRVAERVKASDVERGWQDVDKPVADEMRARVTREARAAEERQKKGSSAQDVKSAPGKTPTEPAEPARRETPAATQPKAATPVLNPFNSSNSSTSRATPTPNQAKAPRTGAGSEPTPNRSGPERESGGDSKPTPSEAAQGKAAAGQRDRPVLDGSSENRRATETPSQRDDSQKRKAAGTRPASPGTTPGDQTPSTSGTVVPAATPAAATGSGAIGADTQAGPDATPNRRPPKAKRPRPAFGPTPEPMLNPAEVPPPAASPAATPEANRQRKADQGGGSATESIQESSGHQ